MSVGFLEIADKLNERNNFVENATNVGLKTTKDDVITVKGDPVKDES